MEEERRREPRRRMLKAGRIVFGSLSRTYDCTLRNTSSGGALLLVPNSLGVPDAFLLYVESEGTRRPGGNRLAPGRPDRNSVHRFFRRDTSQNIARPGWRSSEWRPISSETFAPVFCPYSC
jgi:hypothetical protein